MIYTVKIEAAGYGAPEDEGRKLLEALPDPSEDLYTTVGAHESHNLLLTQLVFNADDGPDAHEQGYALWREAWEEAFEQLGPPLRFSIVVEPGGEIPAGGEARALNEEEELDAELAEMAGDS